MLGKWLFISGLILMGAFALGHLGGFLQAAYAARHDPDIAELTRAMREKKSSLLGFHPSIFDFREYFSLNFSILLLLASAIGFAALATAPAHVIIHRFSPVYVGAMLLLLGTSVYFSVVQGVITCPIIAILFSLAWWLV